MSSVRARCHVVLCGSDYQRIEQAIRYYRGYKICLVSNEHPWPGHKKHDEVVLDRLMNILDGFGYTKKEVFTWPVNYYEFEEALVSLYELFLKLKRDNFELIVNVTGGTKLLASAAVICSMLTKIDPVYIAAQAYEMKKINNLEILIPKGVKEQPILISPLFELTDVLLPTSTERKDVLFWLYHHRKARTVSEMIPFGKNRQKGKGGKKERQKLVAKYTYHANQLISRKLVTKDSRGDFELTKLGDLVARLVEKRVEIEGV